MSVRIELMEKLEKDGERMGRDVTLTTIYSGDEADEDWPHV